VSVRSPSHRITVAQEGHVWHVRPDGDPVVADRDFVLSWRPLYEEAPAGAVFVEEREGERYALLMLLPPTAKSEAGWGLPTETLFIIDVSSSMAGPSIRQARVALLQALDSLRPGDTFNLLKFNDAHDAFSDRFLSANGTDMAAARAWVGNLGASGGTEILPALLRGMEMMADADPWPVQRIILITDGAVGNEEEVSAAVARSLGAARLHIIGIGPAPNRYLMREVARFGRGACEFIVADAELGERMEAFLGRVDRPVMRDLTLDWDGTPPLESYPDRLPDLHAGEPLFVSLKLSPAMRGGRALLGGRLAEGDIGIDLGIAPRAPQGAGVATRWARAKVRSLLDGLHRGADPAQVRAAVIDVARRFNLMTRYTSLVAVEEFRTAEGEWTTRHVANGLPRGSRLLMGVLPQGGTAGPLILVLGLALTCAGATLAWLWRLVR
jgi:Ca-activated chloride channel family protein